MGNRIHIIGNPPGEPFGKVSHPGEIIAKIYIIPVYPELVALVGSRVPDYRGIFLRGLGSQTSTHYGTVTHASASLGELQGDAIRNMQGRVVANPARKGSDPTGPFYANSEGWNNHTDTGSSGTIWFDASRATPTAAEIRPVNRAVRYIIRAR